MLLVVQGGGADGIELGRVNEGEVAMSEMVLSEIGVGKGNFKGIL